MVHAVVLTQHARCPKSVVAVAPREPYVTRGPTEVVVGLYVQGGAFVPNCPQEPRGPDGGTVTVRSKVGAGSTFSFSLPVTGEERGS